MLDTFHDCVSQQKGEVCPCQLMNSNIGKVALSHLQLLVQCVPNACIVNDKFVFGSVWSRDVAPYSVHACLAGEVGYAVAKPNEIGDLEKHEALLPRNLT